MRVRILMCKRKKINNKVESFYLALSAHTYEFSESQVLKPYACVLEVHCVVELPCAVVGQSSQPFPERARTQADRQAGRDRECSGNI